MIDIANFIPEFVDLLKLLDPIFDMGSNPALAVSLLTRGGVLSVYLAMPITSILF